MSQYIDDKLRRIYYWIWDYQKQFDRFNWTIEREHLRFAKAHRL